MTLQSAHDKLLAVDIDRLPPALRAALMNQPLFSVPVQPAGNGFEPAHWPAGLPAEAPQDLFAKLGIKSWRDGGSLRPVLRGAPLRAQVEALLAQPTPAQRAVARAWLDTGTPLLLHLFPWRDFSDVSEVRWLASPRGVRFVSACQRGASGAGLAAAMPKMRAVAGQVAGVMPPTPHLVETACLPDGSVRLVEVNPGLTPVEIRALG